MHKSHLFILTCCLLVSCSGSKTSKTQVFPEDKTQDISPTTKTELEKEFSSLESRELRDKKFKAIVDGKAEAGNRFDTKTKHAATYLEAFRFDLWKGSSSAEARIQREGLFTEASKEFMDRLLELTKRFRIIKISPLFDIRASKDEFTFYAIAVAMDPLLKNLLEQTLQADQTRSPIEAHAEIFVLGENRRVSIALLEARVDVLAALSLKLLTNNAKPNVGQTIEGLFPFKDAAFAHLQMLDLPSVLKADDQVIALLTEAVRTKEFLKSIGINSGLEKNLKSSFRHVKVQADPKSPLQLLLNKILN